MFKYDGRRIWLCLPPINESKRAIFNEATYKQITALIDEDFLQQRARASVLKGVRLSNINSETGEMTFMVRSSEFDKPRSAGQNKFYANTVKFKEWADVVDEEDLKPIERARLLMYDGNLELNCTCPSFLYHGYRYLLTKHNASIFPEPRPPVERNPQQRGIVCKHMNRVIKAFPFHSGQLAAHIKRHHTVASGKDQAWDLKSRIADVLKYDDTIEADYKDIT
jgi:hypothetical protein